MQAAVGGASRKKRFLPDGCCDHDGSLAEFARRMMGLMLAQQRRRSEMVPKRYATGFIHSALKKIR